MSLIKHVPSIFATIPVLFIASLFLYRKREILGDTNRGFFFAVYTGTSGFLVGLFIFVLMRNQHPDDALSLMLSIPVLTPLLFLGMVHWYEPEKGENVLEFLWQRFPEYQVKMLVWMGVVLFIPFIGIFIIQNKTFYGLILFFAVVLITVGVNIFYDEE